ncbi:hypothetical protein FA95DRAFT_1281192 [Auriscalpium vulgare]|uniref:Uncharacterized protein n=1 Tax=Auriscalpium vulgare TaxID=40419 RepID=A0ACB8RSN4_9AGAM|nr:hypothetical protein FA95DRAFT_1281192 [Auriscalpium vulgare]
MWAGKRGDRWEWGTKGPLGLAIMRRRLLCGDEDWERSRQHMDHHLNWDPGTAAPQKEDDVSLFRSHRPCSPDRAPRTRHRSHQSPRTASGSRHAPRSFFPLHLHGPRGVRAVLPAPTIQAAVLGCLWLREPDAAGSRCDGRVGRHAHQPAHLRCIFTACIAHLHTQAPPPQSGHRRPPAASPAPHSLIPASQTSTLPRTPLRTTSIPLSSYMIALHARCTHPRTPRRLARPARGTACSHAGVFLG